MAPWAGRMTVRLVDCMNINWSRVSEMAGLLFLEHVACRQRKRESDRLQPAARTSAQLKFQHKQSSHIAPHPPAIDSPRPRLENQRRPEPNRTHSLSFIHL